MTDPMTPERLAEIESRANEARQAAASGTTGTPPCVDGLSVNDAIAIFVAACADVPALLAEVRRLQAAADERDRLAAERDAFIAGIGFTPAADLVELVEPLSKRIGDAVEHRQCAEGLAWEKRQHEARMAEVRRLQDAVERVRALHAPVEVEPSDTICRECSFRLPNGRYFGKLVEHPCPTIAALDGDEQ